MSTAFGADTTAAEVLQGKDLTGRTAIVTGSGSGIGIETARALVGAGAAVTLAVRDIDAGERVASDIQSSHAGGVVDVAHLDLSDLNSVSQFVSLWDSPLHILINNAGIMQSPLQRTEHGVEMQFAVNHLGHFALATGLHRALVAAKGARVVSVSSSGHGSSGIDFDDPFFLHRPYDPGIAYGQSKTANVLFAVEGGRRWHNDHIVVKAVMPGGIWTNLQRHWDQGTLAAMRATYPGKTPAQGAATSVYAAVDTSITGDGPIYYEDCQPAAIVDRIPDGLHGVVRHALNPESARRLWDWSAKLLAEANFTHRATDPVARKRES